MPLLMHAVWSLGHILKSLGAGFPCSFPIVIVLMLIRGAYLEIQWKNIRKKETVDFHSKWCQLHQGTLCLFFF